MENTVYDTADDTTQYVNALRSSSDRARHVLYLVIVATVLIFIANRNIQQDSWPRRRLDTWYAYARNDGAGTPKPPPQIANGDVERLKAIREEYVKQFAARSVFNASPLPGVSIDVNDLGLIGGIALSFLMFVLVASIAREHENLHLALYKVRLLLLEEKHNRARGDSRANLLYHALAMTQVLNAPPTLARWQQHPAFSVARLVFMVPFCVYAWVVWGEVTSSDVSYAYGVNIEPIIKLELGCAALIFLLGLLAWLHSIAMSGRWVRAFFRVNPGRAVVAQPWISEWLQIILSNKRDVARQRTINNLVDALFLNVSSTAVIPIQPARIRCKRKLISRWDLRRMHCKLVKNGIEAAESQCEKGAFGKLSKLLDFSVASSVLEGQLWTVTGAWTFCYEPKTEGVATATT